LKVLPKVILNEVFGVFQAPSGMSPKFLDGLDLMLAPSKIFDMLEQLFRDAVQHRRAKDVVCDIGQVFPKRLQIVQ